MPRVHGDVHERRLDLPEPPSVNTYWRNVRGRTLLSRAGRAYKVTVRAAYVQAFSTLAVAFPDEPLALTYIWRRKRKAGDLSNRLKALEDALEGSMFTNDAQIVELHGYRRDHPACPGVTVFVRTAHPSAPPSSRAED